MCTGWLSGHCREGVATLGDTIRCVHRGPHKLQGAECTYVEICGWVSEPIVKTVCVPCADNMVLPKEVGKP